MSGGVLVTGGTGFVGQALLRRLSENGHNRIITAVRREEINFPIGIKVEWVGELGPHIDWSACLDGVEVVIHCAALTQMMVDEVDDSLSKFRRVNVEATLALAKQAARVGVHRFIFISSIKVNGECTGLEKAFNPDDIAAPEDAYGISKYEAELGLMDLARKTDMEVVIIRPPLIYGPGVKGNFASMVRWVCKGLPLPLAAIRNKRSLIALNNLVDFILLCADRNRSQRAANEVFLISDGEDVSMTEILRRVAKAYEVPLLVFPLPESLIRIVAFLFRKGDSADRLLNSLVIDGSKAQELLNWKPVVSMNEQLKLMAQHDSCV